MQQAMQSSQRAPAAHLQQSLADSADVSIRPGQTSTAASASELHAPLGGVSPTCITLPKSPSSDAFPDSSTQQQHVPASQQAAFVGSGSAVSASHSASAAVSPLHDTNSLEPVPLGHLSVQPGVFGCTESQREVQHWSATYAQAYLQIQPERVQQRAAASPLAQDGNEEKQPADLPVGLGHMQGSADSLQRPNAYALAHDQDMQQGDPWLAAFLLQAHLQHFTVSMQRAEWEQLLKGLAASSAGPSSLQLDAALEAAAATGLGGAQTTATNGVDSQEHHALPHLLRPSRMLTISSTSSSSSNSLDGTGLIAAGSEDVGSYANGVMSDADDAVASRRDEREVTYASSPQESSSRQQHSMATSPSASAPTLRADGHRR